MAITLPVILTVVVIRSLLSFFDGWIQPIIETIIGATIPGMGLAVTIAIILVVGTVTRNIIGRKLFEFWEKILMNIPVVKNVYGGIRQVFETFASSEKTSFKQVVLFEYPKEGMWSLGFENSSVKNEETGETWVNVLVMTSINPAGGFMVIVPEEKVRRIDVPVESAIKMIISGGIILPEQWKEKALPKISGEIFLQQGKPQKGGNNDSEK